MGEITVHIVQGGWVHDRQPPPATPYKGKQPNAIRANAPSTKKGEGGALARAPVELYPRKAKPSERDGAFSGVAVVDLCLKERRRTRDFFSFFFSQRVLGRLACLFAWEGHGGENLLANRPTARVTSSKVFLVLS